MYILSFILSNVHFTTISSMSNGVAHQENHIVVLSNVFIDWAMILSYDFLEVAIILFMI